MRATSENFGEAKTESCKENPEKKERLNMGEEGVTTERWEGGGAREGRW